MSDNPVLAVVIPVYNETERLPALLRDWEHEFEKTGVPFQIILIDDGSNDNSLQLLTNMQSADPRLAVQTQSNAGHGAAILKGYGLGADAEWVFQVDSDHQLDPAAFAILWASRKDYDLLLAEREQKNASPARQNLSRFALWMVSGLFGKGVKDSNSPYRLMRASDLREALGKIPPDSFAPNVLLTAWFIRKKKRILTTTVRQRSEQGRPSTMNAYMLRGALRSFYQTLIFRLRQ